MNLESEVIQGDFFLSIVTAKLLFPFGRFSFSLPIIFFAVLGNADEWGEIESFAKRKEMWLRKYLELPSGIPTDDTYRIVMGNIGTEHFYQAAAGLLIQTIEGIVLLSGKESRGSKRKPGGQGEAKALQTLNVYSNDYGICLAQKFIDEKTNEISAAQELLGLMDLWNMIVTADAMNCQKDTVSAIVSGKGDYVLALKGNQGLFHEEVRDYFEGGVLENLKGKEGCYKKTVEPEHGGVQSGNTTSRRTRTGTVNGGSGKTQEFRDGG